MPTANCPPPLPGVNSESHRATADTACARALLMGAAMGRSAGNPDPSIDHLLELPPRIGSRSSTAGAVCEWESVAALPRTLRESFRRYDVPATNGSSATSEPDFTPRDLPLIVEDLLVRAKQFADSGAQSEAIEEILDLVAALREGRG